MEHLGAVVRDLGRLTVMELRDEACVGHEPRIGSQDPRDVLPQHDAPRTERAREERRRQIGSAAAERRHASIRRLADEAGDDRERAGVNAAGACGAAQAALSRQCWVRHCHDARR